MVIRYGNFFQFVQSTVGGHVSVAIETAADLGVTIEQIQAIFGTEAQSQAWWQVIAGEHEGFDIAYRESSVSKAWVPLM
ncbi:MAG: hypothetical protein AAFP90_13975 [Planctomycetota bacterium]